MFIMLHYGLKLNFLFKIQVIQVDETTIGAKKYQSQVVTCQEGIYFHINL